MYPKQLGKHCSLPTTCQTSEQNLNVLSVSHEIYQPKNDPNPTNRFNTTPKHHKMSNPPNKIHTQLCTVLNTQPKPHITCHMFLPHPPFLNQTSSLCQSPFSRLTLQGTFLHRTCHLLAGYEKVQCCSQNPNSERLRYFVWFRPSNGHTWIFPAALMVDGEVARVVQLME